MNREQFKKRVDSIIVVVNSPSSTRQEINQMLQALRADAVDEQHLTERQKFALAAMQGMLPMVMESLTSDTSSTEQEIDEAFELVIAGSYDLADRMIEVGSRVKS